MPREVAWSSAGVNRCGSLFCWFEFSLRGVETVDHHFVGAEIRGERVAVGTIEPDAVGVWSFLSFAWTAAFVLFDVARRAETAITLNRQHRDVSARVIREQQTLAAIVHDEMTRIAAGGRLLV